MNEQELLEHMKNMGKSVGDVMSACATSEAVLTGLMANRDQMPQDMFDQMDKSLKESRKGRADLDKELKKMQETFRRNGNNGSR